MRAAVRKMGNSSGVIIPKPLLGQVGLKTGDDVELTLEGDKIVLAPIRRHPRAGWAEASKALAAAGQCPGLRGNRMGTGGRTDRPGARPLGGAKPAA